ncbi:hypothetical protein CJ030_MR6G010872 [Morella rubra]|uniref:Uncharacterized protein n=1 Tax=Morella rubra TaxID=262757 RepID=A0A6A1VEH1_9ROSI|nr:hypothetical protein CJ030_MR6G010872 [Morella rubra]
MEGASVVRIDRKSSIESEPRTLSIDQIQYAREAAMYVMNTRTIEEAMRIFTKGLEPVVNAARDNGRSMIDTAEEVEYAGVPVPDPRDVASAPF